MRKGNPEEVTDDLESKGKVRESLGKGEREKDWGDEDVCRITRA